MVASAYRQSRYAASLIFSPAVENLSSDWERSQFVKNLRVFRAQIGQEVILSQADKLVLGQNHIHSRRTRRRERVYGVGCPSTLLPAPDLVELRADIARQSVHHGGLVLGCGLPGFL